ncbi:MAG: hypothetical protein R3B84_07135 [Zavarzinella sp.]
MKQEKGFSKRVPKSRKWIADLLHASKQVPSIAFEKTMNLEELINVRKLSTPHVPWTIIFLKATAILSSRHPILRQSYLSFPWERIYQHPHVVTSLAIEREFEGEPAVFFAKFKEPQNQSMQELAARLTKLRTEPVEQFGEFRRLIRNTRWPRWLRKLLWGYLLHGSGAMKSKMAGTFSISVTAAEGASAINVPNVTTYCLNYAPFAADGTIRVRLHFDHRVIDGSPVARLMAELETILHTEIVAELRAIAESS